MRFGEHDISREVLIVAEAGNNHEGDIDFARELVRAAAESGAHAIKFQTIRPERLVTPDQTARLEQLRRYELTDDQFAELAQLAHESGILFLSSPFDLESVELLERIADGIKIASGDLDFLPLVIRAAATELPLVISTGGADHDTVARTVEAAGREVVLLHAVPSYPTEPHQADLGAIDELKRHGVPVGYSDHTLGNDACLLAVALGARVLEKHFTLEGVRSDFRDHALSATPAQMSDLVRRVADAQEMLGPAGRPDVQAIRRSIAAGRDLPAGHELAYGDLVWLRPGDGPLRPGQEDRVVGHRLRHAVRAGRFLGPEDVE